MEQTSKIVTTINGVWVIEVISRDPIENPMETYYLVRGEKYETLKQAMNAARRDPEGDRTGQGCLRAKRRRGRRHSRACSLS